MAILFSCKTCGKPYQVDERFAGKKAACRACGTINSIPSDEEPFDVALPAPEMTSLQTMPVRVPHADEGILPLHPVQEESAADRAAANAAAAEGLELSEEPELAPDPTPRPALKVRKVLPIEGCPNCGAALAEGAMVCTACGFNLKTGQKISTAVVATEAAAAAEDAPGETDRRPPTPALRITALVTIIVGVVVSALPILGVRAMAATGPLLGAALAMIGAAIYFIDGAWEWGLAGVGAMVLSVVIMLTHSSAPGPGNTPVPGSASAAPVPAPIPATTQSTPADPLSRIVEVSPGKYSIHAPGPKDDPVEYWRPVLLNEDPKIRAIVIERLAKLPERYRENAAGAIAQAISDQDVEIRRSAIKYLSLAHTPKTVAAAIIALDDEDQAIAAQALKLLAGYKDDSAIEPLAKHYAALGTPILDALGGYDKSSKDKVLAAYKSMLDGGDLQTRAKIIEILVLSDPDAAAKLLMGSLADNDVNIRRASMLRLAVMQCPPAIDPIVAHLRDDPETATKALIQFGPAAEKSVAAKLMENDPAIRLAALNILKQIGTPQSLEPIKAVARETDFPLAIAARQVWRKIEPDGFPPVAEALFDLDGRKEFVTRALTTLKTLPPDEHQKAVARKLFELIMSDAEAPVRALAFEALQTWADESVKDSIIASLKSDIDDSKRDDAIKLAVLFKDRRAVRPLCQCLGEGKNLPAVQAALREFDSAPEEFLIPLILKGDATVQGNCFDVLRDIGTRRCFMALNSVANNKTADEQLKKRAKETLVAINRRLNTAEAEAARKKSLSSHPSGDPSVQH